MLMSGSNNTASKTQVVILTADASFEELARATFNASAQIDLRVVRGTLPDVAESFDVAGATVVVIDLDTSRENEMQALQAFMPVIGTWPPVVVVTQIL